MVDPNADRDPLEMLAAEYMERLRAGERPTMDEYIARHPELAEEIRDLFPTIDVTERLKARHERTSAGFATLGPTRLERLGDFRLIREIGRGGMGVVFEAEQESLGRRVAVKVLPRQVLLDEKHLKRFQREAQIVANLHHTNIVDVFGFGEQDGFHYYVMQYIRGVGLDAVVGQLAKRAHVGENVQPSASASSTDARSPNAVSDAVIRHLLGDDAEQKSGLRFSSHYWLSVARVALQAADALSYAHAQGTLHRDIKPANLLLDPQGTVWLVDFGLAKAAQSVDISLSKDLVGTLRYMAPEQFRGNSDHRSDIYSLGITLYELLTFRSAYDELDHSRLIQKISEGPPPAPSRMSRDMPRDLETIILKAISHDVSQRYQSAEAMADDLRRFLDDRPIRARRVGPAERLGRWCRRNKSLAALTGTSVLLLVLVAVVALVGYARTKSALQREASERAKSEANAGLAIEALDRIFERFSPIRMLRLPKVVVEGVRNETIDVPGSPTLSKEAAALLEEMLPFYDRLAQQTGNDDQLRLRTADANRRVGAIRQRLGQFDEAAKSYGQAIKIYQDLGGRTSKSSKFNLNVAQLENELGRLHTSRGQIDKARQAHLAALALLEGDAAQASSPVSWRLELARTFFFLGTRERPLPATSPRGETGPVQVPDEFRDSLTKAVTLLSELTTSTPSNPECQHLLALCYLEGAAQENTRRSESQGGAERAIEILEGLAKEYSNVPDYAYDLSEAYARIHIPRPPIAEELQKSIEDRFKKSLELLEHLVIRYPDVPDFLASAARTHHRLGSFYRQTERWTDAEQSFRTAAKIQEPLLKRFPDTLYYNVWTATFRIALADVLIRRDRPADARVELEGTLAELSLQLERKPEMTPLHDLLALGYSKLETTLRSLGEARLAADAAQNAERQRNAVRRSP